MNDTDDTINNSHKNNDFDLICGEIWTLPNKKETTQNDLEACSFEVEDRQFR